MNKILKQNKMKKTPSDIALSIILFGIGLLMVLPMFWMFSTSFKYEADVFAMPIEWIPSNPTINNYVTIFQEFPYLTWLKNTVFTTACIVFLVLTFSSLAGYAFAKLDVIGKNIVFFLFVSTMMVPAEVRVIPQFMLYQKLGLINTHASIIVGWSYSAFAIFMMRQFFMSVPDELIEAARIDGSGEFRTFFTIVLPIAKSQLAALGLLAFTWGWNQYFAPLIYINKTNMQVLSVGIASFKSTYGNNFALQMAGASLALIPMIVVYLLAQKQLIEGIATSGIKG